MKILKKIVQNGLIKMEKQLKQKINVKIIIMKEV